MTQVFQNIPYTPLIFGHDTSVMHIIKAGVYGGVRQITKQWITKQHRAWGSTSLITKKPFVIFQKKFRKAGLFR